MVKKEIMIIADYAKSEPITLEELCQICGLTDDFIQSLVEHDIVRPHGDITEKWTFSIEQLQRVKTAQRLQRDLEVNFAGIALVLDLLEELHALRAHAHLVERHYHIKHK